MMDFRSNCMQWAVEMLPRGASAEEVTQYAEILYQWLWNFQPPFNAIATEIQKANAS